MKRVFPAPTSEMVLPQGRLSWLVRSLSPIGIVLLGMMALMNAVMQVEVWNWKLMVMSVVIERLDALQADATGGHCPKLLARRGKKVLLMAPQTVLTFSNAGVLMVSVAGWLGGHGGEGGWGGEGRGGFGRGGGGLGGM